MTLFEVAQELARPPDRDVPAATTTARRPVYGGTDEFQDDPHWRDLILFYEYFHGDNGAGLGASHQTGWTGVAARLIQLFASTDAETLLRGSNRPFTVPYRRLMDAPLGDVADARRSRGAAPTSSAGKE